MICIYVSNPIENYELTIRKEELLKKIKQYFINYEINNIKIKIK
jgi:hypothetical protein